MTITEYLERLPDRSSQDGTPIKAGMMDCCDIWDNDAARGYAARAMERSGISREQMQEVLRQMRYAFDEITVDEAAQIYIDF